MTSWASGSLVGVYVIEGEHARGGLGRVLRAHDRRFNRRVAIKVPLSDDPAAAERCAREARLTARLEHPSIVPIYEEGSTPAGDRYYVMKLVEGRTLAALIAERTDLAGRLELVPNVLQVARAIAHAHRCGIVHRDVKPANVLVGRFGETVVADWGMGQEVDAGDDGAIGGTPAFMAPEQAAGRSADARADVYALGAVLYTVLAGQVPYRGVAPGRLDAGMVSGPPRSLVEVEPGAPRDLVAVVERSMASDPRARYADADGFVADLERFLTGRLVLARSYSVWMRLARWARRHRLTVAITGALTVTLGATIAVAGVEVTAERDAARARAAELLLAQARNALERDPTEAVAWLKQYPADGPDRGELVRLATESVRRGVARHVYLHPHVVGSVAFAPDGARVISGCDDGVARVFDRDRVVVLRGLDTWVDQVGFTRDGRVVVAGDRHARLSVWDLEANTGRIGNDPMPDHRTVGLVFLGPRGALTFHDIGARSWDLVEPGAPRFSDRPPGLAVCCRAVSAAATGDPVLVTSWRARIAVWSDAGRIQRELGRVGAPADLDRGVAAIALSPAGRTAAGVRADGDVHVWDVASGELRTLAAPGSVAAIAISPDERTIAVGSHDGVLLLDPAGGGRRSLTGPSPAEQMLVFSPDGRYLAVAAGESAPKHDRDRIAVYEVATGDALSLARQGQMQALAWSPEGNLLAAASFDRQVRVWAIGATAGAPPTDGRSLEAWFETITSAVIAEDGSLATPVTIDHEIDARR